MTTTTAVHYSLSLLNDPDIAVVWEPDGAHRTTYTWDARGSNLKAPSYKRVTLDFESMEWRVEFGGPRSKLGGLTLTGVKAATWVASCFDMDEVVGALSDRNQRDLMLHAIRRFMRDAGLSVDDLMRGFNDGLSGEEFDAFTDKMRDSAPAASVMPQTWPANRYEWLMLLVDLRRWI